MSGRGSPLLLSCALLVSIPGLAQAQVDAGYLANWRDQEIRVRYDAPNNQTSVILALVPAGGTAQTGGPLILVFEARVPGREVRDAPGSVVVSAYVGPLADARIRRTVEMQLTIDPGAKHSVTLPYFGAAWGVYGFVAPGDEIPVVRFTMSAPDLRALSAAREIAGSAIGFPFSLSASQIDAIRGYARALRIIGFTTS